jgi:putative inorganic carbon (hco3(-)) transporter
MGAFAVQPVLELQILMENRQLTIINHIPRYSLYTLLIFTPLARASVQPWAITTIHMITLIALTTFLLEKTMAWDWKWIRTPLDKPFIALAVLCLLSSVFSLHRVTSLWSMLLLFDYLTIFYLAIHVFRTRAQLRHLVCLIIGVAVFLSLFGLLKYSGSNPFPWWDYPDLDQSQNILWSTFGNRNHLAGYMEMAIPLAVGFFLTGLSGAKRFLLACLIFLLLMTLLLTLSRGGWLGAIIGLSFLSLCLFLDSRFKQKKVLATLIAGIFAVLIIVLSSTPVVERILTLTERDSETNFNSRIVVWGGVMDMIAEYPLTGTGPGTFSFAFTKYQPPGLDKHYARAHNDYLHFTAEAGLPFLFIAAWMVIAFYRKGFRKLKNPSRLVRGISLGAMAGITAILVHSLGDFNLHIPANAILFTVLAAIVVSPLPKHE